MRFVFLSSPREKNEKKIYFFFGKYQKYFISCVENIIKYHKIHSCYALVNLLILSSHSMKYIWYSPQKSKYPLYIGEKEYNVINFRKTKDVPFSTQFRTGYTPESVVTYMNAFGCIS